MEEGTVSNQSETLPVHPAVKPISFLLGIWRGEGEGFFPTISSFNYSEELQFSHSPNKPVIAYSQKTWNLKSGQPMHSESGYWKPKLDGTIEVVIAQSTGLVEVQKGTYDMKEGVVKLNSEEVGNASKVKEISRVFKVENCELSYVVEMATSLIGIQPHLRASLKKL
ncbi:peroxynitrite isomerase Rv2717c-like [Nicotiana tabacum]|uniref:peroxynitrite isomerase Rv2717c-like n=2 Tax=Nicotiana TaxID=4085 RepID=UPI00051B8D9D